MINQMFQKFIGGLQTDWENKNPRTQERDNLTRIFKLFSLK